MIILLLFLLLPSRAGIVVVGKGGEAKVKIEPGHLFPIWMILMTKMIMLIVGRMIVVERDQVPDQNRWIAVAVEDEMNNDGQERAVVMETETLTLAVVAY
jgi:hypothetical protein